MQAAAWEWVWGWVQARGPGAETDPDAEISTEWAQDRAGEGAGAGCGAQGTAGGPSPALLQMHVVHYDAERYANASEAQHHAAGLAVLGVLLEVRGERQPPPTAPQPYSTALSPPLCPQVGDEPNAAYSNILSHLGSIRYAGETAVCEREGSAGQREGMAQAGGPHAAVPCRADNIHPLLQRAGAAARAPGPLLPLQWVPDHPPLLAERALDCFPAARPHQRGTGTALGLLGSLG